LGELLIMSVGADNLCPRNEHISHGKHKLVMRDSELISEVTIAVQFIVTSNVGLTLTNNF